MVPASRKNRHASGIAYGGLRESRMANAQSAGSVAGHWTAHGRTAGRFIIESQQRRRIVTREAKAVDDGRLNHPTINGAD
jgi:hypothetical protein